MKFTRVFLYLFFLCLPSVSSFAYRFGTKEGGNIGLGDVFWATTLQSNDNESDAAICHGVLTNCSLDAHSLSGFQFLPPNTIIGRCSAFSFGDCVINITVSAARMKEPILFPMHANAKNMSLSFESSSVLDTSALLSLLDLVIPTDTFTLSTWNTRYRLFYTRQTSLKKISSVLSNIPSVIWVDSHEDFTIDNMYAASILATGSHAPNSERFGLSGKNELVTVIDTGLDVLSPFFRDDAVFFRPNTKMPDHRKVYYYDAHVDAIESTEGHGTHVCGTIAGQSQCLDFVGLNTSRFDGIAPDSKLYFVDVCQGDCEYLSFPLDVSTLFIEPYKAGSRIFSNSWSSQVNEYTVSTRDIDLFVFLRPDAVVVFSAGNYGKAGLASVSSPGLAKNVISVGASMTSYQGFVDTCCEDNTPSIPSCCYYYTAMTTYPSLFSEVNMATFSSRGPTSDYRIKPDVVAPGEYVTSAAPFKQCGDGRDTVQSKSGTSMACPTIAGFVALVREYLIHNRSVEAPSSSLIKALIISSATSLTGSMDWTGTGDFRQVSPAPSFIQGFGRPNLGNIVRNMTFFVDNVPISTWSQRNWWFRNDNTQSVSVTVVLAYVDYPASPACTSCLVNDLDLLVMRVNGSIAKGNEGLLEGKEWDSKNNVQQAHLSVGPGDSIRVVVHGSYVPVGPQFFALAVRGSSQLTEVEGGTQVCPNNCHASDGNGVCINGVCKCDRHSGADCSIPHCLNDCSGHGVCVLGRCMCQGLFSGDDCSLYHCAGIVTLTEPKGTIQTNVGQRYKEGIECTWIIQPSPVHDRIEIEFISFDTEAEYDVVYIFNSDQNDEDSIVMRHSGSTIPEPVVVNGGYARIVLVTDDNVDGRGFELNYDSHGWYCEGIVQITATVADIATQSYFSRYQPSMDCSWVFMPIEEVHDSQVGTMLQFSKVDIERQFDTVEILGFNHELSNKTYARFSGHLNLTSSRGLSLPLFLTPTNSQNLTLDRSSDVAVFLDICYFSIAETEELCLFVLTQTQRVWVSFTSDDNYSYKGFKAHMRRVSETETAIFDCFGHGNVVDGVCYCKNGYTGLFCQLVVKNCSQNTGCVNCLRGCTWIVDDDGSRCADECECEGNDFCVCVNTICPEKRPRAVSMSLSPFGALSIEFDLAFRLAKGFNILHTLSDRVVRLFPSHDFVFSIGDNIPASLAAYFVEPTMQLQAVFKVDDREILIEHSSSLFVTVAQTAYFYMKGDDSSLVVRFTIPGSSSIEYSTQDSGFSIVTNTTCDSSDTICKGVLNNGDIPVINMTEAKDMVSPPVCVIAPIVTNATDFDLRYCGACINCTVIWDCANCLHDFSSTEANVTVSSTFVSVEKTYIFHVHVQDETTGLRTVANVPVLVAFNQTLTYGHFGEYSEFTQFLVYTQSSLRVSCTDGSMCTASVEKFNDFFRVIVQSNVPVIDTVITIGNSPSFQFMIEFGFVGPFTINNAHLYDKAFLISVSFQTAQTMLPAYTWSIGDQEFFTSRLPYVFVSDVTYGTVVKVTACGFSCVTQHTHITGSSSLLWGSSIAPPDTPFALPFIESLISPGFIRTVAFQEKHVMYTYEGTSLSTGPVLFESSTAVRMVAFYVDKTIEYVCASSFNYESIRISTEFKAWSPFSAMKSLG
ncbi:hypothetical protein PCE1_001602 [Barthelona sp. PCE]